MLIALRLYCPLQGNSPAREMEGQRPSWDIAEVVGVTHSKEGRENVQSEVWGHWRGQCSMWVGIPGCRRPEGARVLGLTLWRSAYIWLTREGFVLAPRVPWCHGWVCTGCRGWREEQDACCGQAWQAKMSICSFSGRCQGEGWGQWGASCSEGKGDREEWKLKRWPEERIRQKQKPLTLFSWLLM